MDGQVYEDFRRISMEKMVPYLVGAIKEMYKRQLVLEEEIRKLTEAAAVATPAA